MNGMSRSDAGKLGAEKSKATIAANHQSRVQEYDLNPKLCAECQSPLDYDRRKNNFCNRSCAASFNNREHVRNGQPMPRCPCGEKVKERGRTHCSMACKNHYNGIIRASMFENGDIERRELLRKFVIDRDGYKCSICCLTEWNSQPAPLVLDHIDGNADNNLPDNLRMVCGNCDMQLPTYKSRNIGKGRHARRQRYRDGKSF